MFSFFFSTFTSSGVEEDEDEKVNIFSVASGHLYERFLRIMMVSVLRHTKTPVKFWFLKNFLSPTVKVCCVYKWLINPLLHKKNIFAIEIETKFVIVLHLWVCMSSCIGNKVSLCCVYGVYEFIHLVMLVYTSVLAFLHVCVSMHCCMCVE